MYHCDLLQRPLIGRFLRSRLYPTVFQYPSLFLFFLILLWAFLGTVQASRNIATLTMWSLWWPLLPFSFLLLGRIWCGVCPLAKAGDLVQGCLRSKGRYPGSFLKNHGIWIMIGLFILLTWFDRISSFAGSPRSTGLLLSLLLIGALVTMLFFQRRTWCRYLCPLGGLSGIYSTASFMELRPRKETCRKDCRDKACITRNESRRKCPFFERPLALESNRNCNLCGNCVKACQHRALSWHLRLPLKELGQLRGRVPAEAFFAVIMVILVYIQTMSMSKLFPHYMKWFIEGTFIRSYHVAFSINFAGLLLLGLALYVLATYVSSHFGRESFTNTFTSFGYALIPLGLAGHLSHNLFHLVKEGMEATRTVLTQAGTLVGIVGDVSSYSHHALEGEDPFIKLIQITIVLLGAFGSLLVIVKSDRTMGGDPHFNWKRIMPYMLLVAVVGVSFLHVFLLPMNPRHFH